METVILAIALGALFVTNAALAAYLARRPDDVVRIVARLAPHEGAVFMTSASRLGPYRWLLSGSDWGGFITTAPVAPEHFPRLVHAVRALGVATLLVNVSIIAVVVVMSITG